MIVTKHHDLSFVAVKLKKVGVSPVPDGRETVRVRSDLSRDAGSGSGRKEPGAEIFISQYLADLKSS